MSAKRVCQLQCVSEVEETEVSGIEEQMRRANRVCQLECVCGVEESTLYGIICHWFVYACV